MVIVNYGRSMLVKWSYKMTVCTLSDQKVIHFSCSVEPMATKKGRPLSTIPEEVDDLKTPVDPAFIEYGSEDSYTVASGNYPL